MLSQSIILLETINIYSAKLRNTHHHCCREISEMDSSRDINPLVN